MDEKNLSLTKTWLPTCRKNILRMERTLDTNCPAQKEL